MSSKPLCGQARIGWIVGESTPLRSYVLFDKGHVPRAGSYITAEGDEGCVLGVLEKVVRGNMIVTEDVTDASQLGVITKYKDLDREHYTRGVVRWLSLADPLRNQGKVVSPSIPLEPASPIYQAPSSLLHDIFAGMSKRWVRIGALAGNPNVEFSIDVNKLTRHLAILAVTGGGKSNTVNILAHRIVSGLGGTMVIFDIHGEYAVAASNLAPGRAVVKQPVVNPLEINFHELKRLARIPDGAHVQERILREAWKAVLQKYPSKYTPGTSFLDALRIEVRRAGSQMKRQDSMQGTLNRIDDIEDYYGQILDERTHRRLTDIIEPGKLNIFDLSGIDEVAADAVVSHYMRRILEERKIHKRTQGASGYPVPLLVVVEEAHVLIPRDEDTLTKTWASRIAREGRKFGVGLVLVSQRPKNVDADVLSQTNNKIILKIVEPSDQRYVQAASEQLSEDLLELLPALNPGEAIVIGSMTKLPAMVKIDYCADICGVTTGGADIDVVKEWEKYNSGSGDEDLNPEVFA
ncbi:MAG: ATP-binding protein [Desulfurococcales archaeon]|nr:ATP-binding protein [Desulfurococcales archaeon]